jgi:hypothetical protein
MLPVIPLIRLLLEITELIPNHMIPCQHMPGLIMEIIPVSVDIIMPALLERVSRSIRVKLDIRPDTSLLV